MTGGPPVAGLDHVLVGVRDLEGARRAYEALGFVCTPRGRHIGWGTANYCIMFARDYIELLGIVDPSQFTNNLDVFLERREGLMGVAFASADAEASRAALLARGVAAEEPRALARDLELPEGTVQPRFRLVHMDADATPALPAFVCQHLTPELMRRPEWLDHPNGARGIRAVTTVVDDPPALADAYARTFGAGAVTLTDAVLTLHLGGVAFIFANPDDFDLLFDGVGADAASALPYMAALTVSVGDIGRVAVLLERAGIAAAAAGERSLIVAPEQAAGVVLEFCAERPNRPRA